MYRFGMSPHWSCVSIPWERQHGSLLRANLQQEIQLKGGGEGSQLTESNLVFPRVFPRSIPRNTSFPVAPHPLHEYTCVCGHLHILFIMPLLFHVVPKGSPYQTGIVRETGARPDITTALGRRPHGAITVL